MKVPFFPSIGAGNPSTVVNLALHELGLDENFLLRALIAANGKPVFTAGELDFGKMGCTEWIWVCQKLHLPIDSISTGYSRIAHRAWVGQAILDGAYVLPITDRLRALFREFISLQRQSFRSEKEYYGPELRRKIVLGRFEERKLRRKLRKHNARVGAPKRRKYVRLHTQSLLGAPILVPTLKKRRPTARPGLKVQIEQEKAAVQASTDNQ